MDLLAWIPVRWLVLLHVLSAAAFLLMHGPSIAAMLMLRQPQDPATTRTLLSLSRRASLGMFLSVDALAITGALLATIEHVWALAWVWGSIAILLAVTVAMGPLATRPFNEARLAAGLPWMNGRRTAPAEAPDDAALAVAVAKIRRRAPWTMAVGVVSLAVLLWLMVLRPEI